MKCTPIALPGGGVAIVCGPKPPQRRCPCGNVSTRLCDWKKRPGVTCDKPLCDSCTNEPAPGKDLCPDHAAAWVARKQAK